MPPERAFSSVIPLFAVVDLVAAEAASYGQCIAPLNGDGQALAQDTLACFPHAPRVSNARGEINNTFYFKIIFYL